MCSKEHLLEERVEGAETLAYLMEPDVELQRIASTTDHLVAMLADYFKYPSSVSAITDIKRVGQWAWEGSFYMINYLNDHLLNMSPFLIKKLWHLLTQCSGSFSVRSVLSSWIMT